MAPHSEGVRYVSDPGAPWLLPSAPGALPGEGPDGAAGFGLNDVAEAERGTAASLAAFESPPLPSGGLDAMALATVLIYGLGLAWL